MSGLLHLADAVAPGVWWECMLGSSDECRASRQHLSRRFAAAQSSAGLDTNTPGHNQKGSWPVGVPSEMATHIPHSCKAVLGAGTVSGLLHMPVPVPEGLCWLVLGHVNSSTLVCQPAALQQEVCSSTVECRPRHKLPWPCQKGTWPVGVSFVRCQPTYHTVARLCVGGRDVVGVAAYVSTSIRSLKILLISDQCSGQQN